MCYYIIIFYLYIFSSYFNHHNSSFSFIISCIYQMLFLLLNNIFLLVLFLFIISLNNFVIIDIISINTSIFFLSSVFSIHGKFFIDFFIVLNLLNNSQNSLLSLASSCGLYFKIVVFIVLIFFGKSFFSTSNINLFLAFCKRNFPVHILCFCKSLISGFLIVAISISSNI